MKLFVWVILALSLIQCSPKPDSKPLQFGVIADCQYCNCEPTDKRFYRKSPKRLQAAVDTFNGLPLKFTIHLGDFIDKDYSSFDTVLPIWNQLQSKKYHVLGNHDFSVADSIKQHVPKKLGLANRYYSFKYSNWRFLVLDGTDLSMYATLDTINFAERDSLYAVLKEERPYVRPWNGAVGSKQLDWIERELSEASEQKHNVGLFCHFPLLPEDKLHNLWNNRELIALLEQYPQVQFFFNGHNHDGAYLEKNGIHYHTFKGMVDTPNQTAFSVVKISDKIVDIKGYGRSDSRKILLH